MKEKGLNKIGKKMEIRELELRLRIAKAEKGALPRSLNPGFRTDLSVWNHYEGSGHCLTVVAERVGYPEGPDGRLELRLTRLAEFKELRDGSVAEVTSGHTTGCRQVRAFSSWEEAMTEFVRETEADERFRL
jgi:hypothetical protein